MLNIEHVKVVRNHLKCSLNKKYKNHEIDQIIVLSNPIVQMQIHDNIYRSRNHLDNIMKNKDW
jgi:hypothetical protein